MTFVRRQAAPAGVTLRQSRRSGGDLLSHAGRALRVALNAEQSGSTSSSRVGEAPSLIFHYRSRLASVVCVERLAPRGYLPSMPPLSGLYGLSGRCVTPTGRFLCGWLTRSAP
jgi:hypothetical protein